MFSGKEIIEKNKSLWGFIKTNFHENNPAIVLTIPNEQ